MGATYVRRTQGGSLRLSRATWGHWLLPLEFAKLMLGVGSRTHRRRRFMFSGFGGGRCFGIGKPLGLAERGFGLEPGSAVPAFAP